MRAILIQAGDAEAVATALGYPHAGLRTDHTIAPGAGLTLRHRDVEKDDQGRDVLVVDDVESALPAPLRARVVNVAKAVVVEAIE